MKPTPKIQAATASGAVAIIVVWVAGLFGLDMPDTVAAAFAVLAAAAGGYFKSDGGRHADS